METGSDSTRPMIEAVSRPGGRGWYDPVHASCAQLVGDCLGLPDALGGEVGSGRPMSMRERPKCRFHVNWA